MNIRQRPSAWLYSVNEERPQTEEGEGGAASVRGLRMLLLCRIGNENCFKRSKQ